MPAGGAGGPLGSGDRLEWPSGQRRWPLRDTVRFTPSLCRAARALLGWSAEALAARAGWWPRDVGMAAGDVERFEAGGELAEIQHAAICEALYHEGYGVIVVKPGSAGEGVRFAKAEAERAQGTYAERRWRPVLEQYRQDAARHAAWSSFMVAQHGPHWWADPSLSIAPPFGWQPPEAQPQRTNEQSDPVPGEASHAP